LLQPWGTDNRNRVNSEGVHKFQPRNYEAGSPKVDLKVGQYVRPYTSLAFAG
jgi:hypothetical protein